MVAPPIASLSVPVPSSERLPSSWRDVAYGSLWACVRPLALRASSSVAGTPRMQLDSAWTSHATLSQPSPSSTVSVTSSARNDQAQQQQRIVANEDQGEKHVLLTVRVINMARRGRGREMNRYCGQVVEEVEVNSLLSPALPSLFFPCVVVVVVVGGGGAQHLLVLLHHHRHDNNDRP